jgi:hypothetical protein
MSARTTRNTASSKLPIKATKENQKQALKKKSEDVTADVPLPTRRRHLSIVEDNVNATYTVVPALGEQTKQQRKSVKTSPKKTKLNKISIKEEKGKKGRLLLPPSRDPSQLSRSAGEVNETKKDDKEKRNKLLSVPDSLAVHRKRSVDKPKYSGDNKADKNNKSDGSKKMYYGSKKFSERVLDVLQIPDSEKVIQPAGPQPIKSPLPLPEGVINIDIEDGMLEYGAEIVTYLKGKEKEMVISHDFIDDSHVTKEMRSILVDWLTQVQHHLKLSQECLYLTIAMLDTVLARRDVQPDKLQLVGVTSLWLASKLEEYYPAETDKLVHLTENSYKKHHIIQMEVIILDILQFKVYSPQTMVFLLRYVKAALRSGDEMFIETCQYLLDSFIVRLEYSCTVPSLRAAASVLAALSLFSSLVVDQEVTSFWSATLVHYTGYTQDQLAPTALDLLDLVNQAARGETKLMGAHAKYKSNSQHKKLVLQRHLQPEVIKRAIDSLRQKSE